MRCLGALLLSVSLPAQQGTPAEASVERFQALIDAFHHAMPRDPADLRDAELRARVAPAAIPAIRALEEWLREHDEEGGSVERIAELSVYAQTLGDPRFAGEDDDALPARLRRAAASLVVASESEARGAAVEAYAGALAETSDADLTREATGATLAVVRAAVLEASEARALAKVAPADVAKLLIEAAERAENDPRHRVGRPLVLEGVLRTGETFTTASWRGKVVLVDFWATWCVPCVRALPHVVELRERFGAEGLEVLGVSCDRDAGDLTAFLAEHPEVAWPQLFDAENPGWHALAASLGVTAIPRVFVIDRRGVLRGVDASGPDLVRLVEELLREEG